MTAVVSKSNLVDMNTFELLKPQPGLRVLITGAASGIGAAMAQAFVEAGAKVVICDVDAVAVDAFAATNSSLRGCLAAVSDPDQVDRRVSGKHDPGEIRPTLVVGLRIQHDERDVPPAECCQRR